jgi:hypothetical protein
MEIINWNDQFEPSTESMTWANINFGIEIPSSFICESAYIWFAMCIGTSILSYEREHDVMLIRMSMCMSVH